MCPPSSSLPLPPLNNLLDLQIEHIPYQNDSSDETSDTASESGNESDEASEFDALEELVSPDGTVNLGTNVVSSEKEGYL